MQNHVERTQDDIILAVRAGAQTEESIRELCGRITEEALRLRSEAKPVLVLSDVTAELPLSEAMEKLVIELGETLDFDKCAFFPASGRTKSVRDVKVHINGFDLKVQNFGTKEEALCWLQSFKWALSKSRA